MRDCSMAESKTGDGSLNFAKVTLGWPALCLPAIGLANDVCAEIPDGVSVRPYVIEDVEFRALGAFRIIYAVSDGTVLWVRFDSIRFDSIRFDSIRRSRGRGHIQPALREKIFCWTGTSRKIASRSRNTAITLMGGKSFFPLFRRNSFSRRVAM